MQIQAQVTIEREKETNLIFSVNESTRAPTQAGTVHQYVCLADVLCSLKN